ncbi:T9SS type B sorting domain-containing protein [Taibaiella koreensis]|uniref:T9SS type B sorting domain-containing protein n=1 Tax=Taibaiella koreensis TaxID=1268548 RepID=UPI000E59A8C1|nr:gliding motility-associated C-terminal domain-containing protein [Taibaiella koreensis]
MKKITRTKCGGLAIRITLTLLILIPAAFPSQAQREQVWAFGTHAGLDFSSGAPVPIQTGMEGFGEANASVCDPTGQLLFYTNGTDVWARDQTRMPNGHNLTGISPPGLDTAIITSSTSQGALIVPMPDSAGKYYVFSLTAFEMGGMQRGRLYYSIVDMSLNGGLGDVMPGRKGIFVDSGLTEKMTAVAGDRCNIWVITSVLTQTRYKVFEITTAGLQTTPVISNTAMADQGIGNFAVSPNRKWISASGIPVLLANPAFGLHLAAFDAATGAISNDLVLDANKNAYGTCFSPDNSKLYYLSSDGRIYQFDLSLGTPAAIIASEVAVGTPNWLTHLKRAPDGKIYFNCSPTQLGVIANPGLAGAACGLTPNTITLAPGTTTALGLPNVVVEQEVDSLISPPKAVTGQCFAQNAILHAGNTTTAWAYHWSTGATTPQISVSAPGNYWVSYHTGNPCRFYTDSFSVSFPLGALPFVQTVNSCKGAANGKAWVVNTSWDTSTIACTWQNGSHTVVGTGDTLSQVPAGYYTVHLVTAAGCDTVLPVYIDEEEHNVTFTVDTVVCLGDQLTFRNTSDNHFTLWLWDFGDGQQSSLAAPVHTYSAAGSYEVTLQGQGSICADTLQKLVQVDQPVTGIALTKDKNSICTGESILFTPLVDSTATGLDWRFGTDSRIAAAPGVMSKAFDRPGLYPVLLTAHFRACPDVHAMDSVTVHALPLVDLGPDSVLCLGGKPLLLANHAVNIPDVYHFDWSSGEHAETIEVRHQGRYGLTLTNSFGCTASEAVEVKKDCYIDIPNAFTPNGDGVNDYFFPRSLLSAKLTGFSMSIYNRWGQLIFETTATNGRGWDGRFNGKEQPEGVYLYRMEVMLDGAIRERYEGNVTLIR